MGSKKGDIKQIDFESRRLSSLISDVNVPIESFMDNLFGFISVQKAGQEPYAMLLRNAFGVGKNAMGAQPLNWANLLKRIEQIMSLIDKYGTVFAKVIFNESMGHRYSDLWFESKNSEYETKMKHCYILAHEQAKLENMYKNIDSTMFWLATAYHRMGKFEEAKFYHKIVADRGAPRYLKSSFISKILLSIIYSRDSIVLPPYTDILKILDRKNPVLGPIYTSFQPPDPSNIKITNSRLIKFIVYWDSIEEEDINPSMVKSFIKHNKI